MRAKRGWVITKPKTALRPSQCRVWMQRTLAENFPEILERFLDDATPKSLSHMRLVTELLEADVKKVKRKRSSFQRMLQDFAVDEKAGKARLKPAYGQTEVQRSKGRCSFPLRVASRGFPEGSPFDTGSAWCD